MDDSSNIVEAGVHHLQSWYPPLIGLYGPRNVDVVPTQSVRTAAKAASMMADRGAIPAPLTVPYYRYHLSPLFQQCALGKGEGAVQACLGVYGDFIAQYENDDLHGARART